MYFGLTEEQEMIVETVRSFVENEIYPHENLVENKGFVPTEIAQDIKKKCVNFHEDRFRFQRNFLRFQRSFPVLLLIQNT